MTSAARAIRTGIVCLAVFSSSGCARMSGWSDDLVRATGGVLFGQSVGHIAGRVEQAPDSFSVISLDSVDASRRWPGDEAPTWVSIEQGRQSPPIAALRPDQILRIENLDPIHHEIFSADAENPLRVPLPGGHTSDGIRLSSPGLVQGYCRMHPNESFTFLITDSDHFVYAEGKADFEFSRVPGGDYHLRTTALDGKTDSRRVYVTAGETLEVTIRPRARATR